MPEWVQQELIVLSPVVLGLIVAGAIALFKMHSNYRTKNAEQDQRIMNLERENSELRGRLAEGSAKFDKIGSEIHSINVNLGKSNILLEMLCKKNGIDVELD